MEKTASNVALIREFFGEGDYGRKVEMSEQKVLTPDDRQELGDLIRATIK
jgi:hypothetical protein